MRIYFIVIEYYLYLQIIINSHYYEKYFYITALISFGSIFSSCKDEPIDNPIDTPGDDPYKRDETLAGSIAFFLGYVMEAEGTYDGAVLDEYSKWTSYVIISDVSNSEVVFFVHSWWDGTLIEIETPAIVVLGEPYNVAFDYATKDTWVLYNDIDYKSVDTSTKGWMKCIDKIESSQASDNTRSMPVALEYTCDINIICLVNGKTLHLKITSLS